MTGVEFRDRKRERFNRALDWLKQCLVALAQVLDRVVEGLKGKCVLFFRHHQCIGGRGFLCNKRFECFHGCSVVRAVAF